jgi:hypothetical protein
MRNGLWLAAAMVTLAAFPRVAQARYLMAQNANFLQPDPAGMPEGPNRYAYVANSPTRPIHLGYAEMPW